MARIEPQVPNCNFYTMATFAQLFRPDIFKFIFRILTRPIFIVQCSIDPLHFQCPSDHLQLVPSTAHPIHNAQAE